MSVESAGDIGAVLQGVGALAQAFAIGFAAWLASNTFDGWRKQKISERKIEQAENILIATYNVRQALGFVRHPLTRASELAAAQEFLEKQAFWKTLDASKQKLLVSEQSVYNRLNESKKEMQAIIECLPMARALFDENVEKALLTLNHQFHLVKIAAEANSWEGNEREFQRSIREDLSSSSGSDRPNKMNDTIENQVLLIENVLIPILRL